MTKPFATNREDPTTEAIAQQLLQHLQALPGPRDPYLESGRHQLAQQYIRAELGRWGEVSREGFVVGDGESLQGSREYCNWQLLTPGTEPSLAPILVGAHYDTVPGSPGADDNASGVAALLSLAALWAQNPGRRSIYWVAFDLEEYGLVGSSTCAQRWRAENRPLHLMLSLEMLGYFSDVPQSQQYPLPWLSRLYPSTGNFIALIGNAAATMKMMTIQRCLSQAGAPCRWLPVVNQGRQIPPTRYSDHSPFWDVGYSALMVTDTAHLRNPHYHTERDRVETLNLEMMANITLGLANSLRQL
jgi:aminopeptidase YwaD